MAYLELHALSSLDVFAEPRALHTLSAYMRHRTSHFLGIGLCFSVPRLTCALLLTCLSSIGYSGFLLHREVLQSQLRTALNALDLVTFCVSFCALLASFNEFVFFISSTVSSFTLDHMEKLKYSAFVVNSGHFGNEFDLAGSEGFGDNSKPQSIFSSSR